MPSESLLRVWWTRNALSWFLFGAMSAPLCAREEQARAIIGPLTFDEMDHNTVVGDFYKDLYGVEFATGHRVLAGRDPGCLGQQPITNYPSGCNGFDFRLCGLGCFGFSVINVEDGFVSFSLRSVYEDDDPGDGNFYYVQVYSEPSGQGDLLAQYPVPAGLQPPPVHGSTLFDWRYLEVDLFPGQVGRSLVFGQTGPTGYVAAIDNLTFLPPAPPSIEVESDPLVIDEGQSSLLRIRLTSAPSQQVALQVSLGGFSDALFSLGEVTQVVFDEFNFDEYAEVLVLAGEDDSNFVDGAGTILISDPSSLIDDRLVALHEVDNDAISFVVSEEPLIVPEGGFAVQRIGLSAPPPSDVKIQVKKRSGDNDLLVLNGSPPSSGTFRATFTPDQWNLTALLEIEAKPDNDTSNGQATFRISQTSGSISIDPKDFVAEEDETGDGPSIVVENAPQEMDEGTTEQFEVVLNQEPPEGQAMIVGVGKASGSDTSFLVFEQFHFDQSNWNIPQTGSIELREDQDTEDGTGVIEAFHATNPPAQIRYATAEFSIQEIDDDIELTLAAVGDGDTIPTGVEIVDTNDDMPFTVVARPSQGATFEGWSSSPPGILADPSAPQTSVTTSVDATVTATFSGTPAQATLTVYPDGSGLCIPWGPRVVDTGIPQAIRAFPDEGHTFVAWTGDIAGIADPSDWNTTITISQDATIYAAFDDAGNSNVSVFVGATEGGWVNPAGTNSVAAGSPLGISASALQGYSFSHWSSSPPGLVANSASANTSVTTSVSATVTAHFLEDSVTLTVLSGPNGSVWPSQATGSVGDVIQIAATPDPGYAFWGWSGDTQGIADPGSASTTITLTSSGVIYASFDYPVEGEEQPPCHNGPPSCGSVLGVSSGCGGGGSCSPFAMNRVGPGTILPHSGQEMREERDLFIEGRDPAVNLEIRRRHLTRVNHDRSLFGPAWSFNYRQYFEEVGGGDLDMHGFGRVDRFVRVGSNIWEGTTGRFGRMSLHDGVMTLRMAGGTRLLFQTWTGGGIRGVVSSIHSPNDNQIAFTYDGVGELLDQKLIRITESYGREVELFYEDTDYPQGISRIRDFTNREWIYDYNNLGQILSVRSPTITSTGGFNDFPNGKRTYYTYRQHPDPRLTHALTSLVLPNQLGGKPAYEWTYHEDPALPIFGFVSTHTIGAPDFGVGGIYHYEYQTLPQGANGETMRVSVTDRMGTLSDLTFNRLGQLCEERVHTKGIRIGEPDSYTRSLRYNDDGMLVENRRTLGGVTELTLTDNADHPRTSHGNASLVERFADGRGADQVSIRIETIYEPVFNKVFRQVDPRGFEQGNQPSDYTTTHYLDYMEDLSAARSYFAPLMGISEAQLQVLFDEAGIVSTGDVNGDGRTDQKCGNVIKIEYPLVDLPELPRGTAVTRGVQAADELYQFNDYGQLTLARDAEENVTVLEYYGAADPSGLVSGIDPLGGGYLARTVEDAVAAPGRNSGTNPSPVQRETTFSYRAMGALPENQRGVPVSITDGRGVRSSFLINELDQVVLKYAADDVAASPDPSLTVFGYEEKFQYDANDNVVAHLVQHKDNLAGDDDFVETRYAYDILNHRVVEVLDFFEAQNDPPPPSDALQIRNLFEYDANENLVRSTRGLGTPEQVTDEYRYDERDVIVSVRRGVGLPEESLTHNVIDDNGNITEWIDAEGGHSRLTVLDGYDRVVQRIDRLGNREEYRYDSADHVVGTLHYGPVDASSAAEELLARTDMRYDARGRAFRVDKHLFHYAGRSVGALDDGALDPGDGLVSTLMVLDRLGRTVGVVDADADVSVTAFDGISRPIATQDALGNSVEREFDSNGNVVSTRSIQVSPLISTNEVFEWSSRFDALNRLVEEKEPNGQTTLYEYDSQNSLVRSIDTLGNQVEYEYDRLTRPLLRRTFLSADGTNASWSNRDVSQGGGDGMIQVSSEHDALHRLVARIDDRDNETRYTYDGLDRKVRCDYPDGTNEQWAYNADGELLTRTTQSGAVESWNHDAEGRPISVDFDKTGATTTHLGSDRREWGYDGIDRVVYSFDDNGGGRDVEYETWYDSLSRQIRETQLVGQGPALSVDAEWSGEGRRVSLTYPNGRKVLSSYDARDRVSVIHEADGELIAGFEYVGPRVISVHYGNGTYFDQRSMEGTHTVGGDGGYDTNGRSIRQRWQTSFGATVAEYLSQFNGRGGVGTSRRVEENRVHLNHLDRYSMDSAYRMISFEPDSSAAASHRVLDGVDRMTSLTDEGVERALVVDGDVNQKGMNQYSSVDGVPRTYTDDGARQSDARFDYFYDANDRLVQVRVSGASWPLAEYEYAADGRRVLRSVGEETTRYLSWDWEVLEERSETNDVLRQYVTTGAHFDDLIQLRDVGSNQDYYYHGNSHGSVGALTDSSQVVEEFYEYGWFGRPTTFMGDGTTTIEGGLVPDDASSLYGSRVARVEAHGVEDVREALWSPGQVIGYFLVFATDAGSLAFPIVDHSHSGEPAFFEVRENLMEAGIQEGQRFTIRPPRVQFASAVGNPYRFHARRQDPETDLYYYRHRYYDPDLGEFLTLDPLGTWAHGQGNGYSAFGEDGWNAKDPLGLLDLGAYLSTLNSETGHYLVQDFVEAAQGARDLMFLLARSMNPPTSQQAGQEWYAILDEMVGLEHRDHFMDWLGLPSDAVLRLIEGIDSEIQHHVDERGRLCATALQAGMGRSFTLALRRFTIARTASQGTTLHPHDVARLQLASQRFLSGGPPTTVIGELPATALADDLGLPGINVYNSLNRPGSNTMNPFYYRPSYDPFDNMAWLNEARERGDDFMLLNQMTRDGSVFGVEQLQLGADPPMCSGN